MWKWLKRLLVIVGLLPVLRFGVGRGRVGVNPDLQGEAPVWQKRFWERHIRGDEEFAACVRYCRINPVKHGLVGHPGEWPYSSWHRDAGGDAGV